MPLPAVVDPLTLVHRQLWSALTGFADWAALVTLTNRIRFDAGEPDPVKAVREATDLPEVGLVEGKFDWQLFDFDASAGNFTHSFQLVATHADLNLIPVNTLRWQTLRALTKVGPYLGLPSLVRKFACRGGAVSASAQPGQADLSQWATLVNVDVLFTLSRAQVLAGTFPSTVVPYGV
jgi:hypothetical protein